MDDRREDVAGRFVGQLHDELAQVGLDDADPGGGQRRVQTDLLADHRFGFDDSPHLSVLGQLQNQGLRLARISRPVHLTAVGDEVALQLFEQLGQVRDGVFAHRANRVTQARAVDLAHRPGSPGGQMFGGPVERHAQRRIAERLAHPRLVRRADVNRHRFEFRRCLRPRCRRPTARRCARPGRGTPGVRASR